MPPIEQTSVYDTINQFLENNQRRFLDELLDFLKYPSISALPQYRDEVRRTALFLKEHLQHIGLENCKLLENSGHPIVYAEWLHKPEAPTVLVYGHYDVQPVDPVELWTSPPFEPDLRNGKIYARGAVDDKGQIFVHLKALEAWLANFGELPVNVKVVIEGEEEVGSPFLESVLRESAKQFEADYILVSDTGMFQKGLPSITYGIRGLAYAEIEVKGSKIDLHSGSFGGAVINPINALVRILASMKDEHGRITIPGFYDDVRSLTEQEKETLRHLPFNETDFAASIGAPALYGEEGFNTLERLWARPTFDINGIWGGFQGEGTKTVIPAEAHAKVSMRLVPDQQPQKIMDQFVDYVKSLAPPEVVVKVTPLYYGQGYVCDLDNPGIQAAQRALLRGFGVKPAFIREGGSIPIVSTFTQMLKAPAILIGFGLPDENAHAPDENFDLDNFYGGIRSIVYFYQELASET